MRCVAPLAAAFLACGLWGQQIYSTYTYDVNGDRVESSRRIVSKTDDVSSDTTSIESINQRRVPIERVRERVLEESASVRMVEVTARPYDQNGDPGPPRKTVIEERKNPDGTTTVKRTVYHGDLNGSFHVWERSTAQSRESDGVRNSQTVVERPGFGGTLETVEKRVVTQKEQQDRMESDTVTYRRGENGGFYPAVRETTAVVKHDNQVTETATRYNTAITGEMALAGMTVTTTDQHPDGSESKVVRVYGDVAPGRTIEGTPRIPKLREEQLIERKKGQGGSVVETFGIRRPTLANPHILGPYRKISETICTGDCELTASKPKEEQPPEPKAEQESEPKSAEGQSSSSQQQ
jgi:hypothetical protein